jgi:hypothetical protein
MISSEIAARADRRMEKCRKRGRVSLADLEFTKNEVHDLAAELDSLRARAAELEQELAQAVDVSETLSRALQDEMLAGSALYAALTMPTTPTQRQAALDQFTTVAQKIGQIHGPAEADRIVAYRAPGSGPLYCRECCHGGGNFTPLTSDDLPDGGLCDACGVDVLIDPVAKDGAA